jgi:hypothetical protein
MLTCMFLFLPSFQNSGPQVEVPADSSMTIQLKFDNPRILIDDYRNFQAWAELVRSGVEVNSALTEALSDLGMTIDQYIVFQERRYESAMDYLTRRTDLSVDTIEKLYDKKRKTDISLIIFAFVLLLIAWYSAFGGTNKNLVGGWKRQMAIFTSYSISFGIGSLLLYYLLLFTVNSGYQHMNQMLNLSG